MNALIPKAAAFVVVPALTYALAPQKAMAGPNVKRDVADTAASLLATVSVGAFVLSLVTKGTTRSVAQSAGLGSALAAGLVLLSRPALAAPLPLPPPQQLSKVIPIEPSIPGGEHEIAARVGDVIRIGPSLALFSAQTPNDVSVFAAPDTVRRSVDGREFTILKPSRVQISWRTLGKRSDDGERHVFVQS